MGEALRPSAKRKAQRMRWGGIVDEENVRWWVVRTGPIK